MQASIASRSSRASRSRAAGHRRRRGQQLRAHEPQAEVVGRDERLDAPAPALAQRVDEVERRAGRRASTTTPRRWPAAARTPRAGRVRGAQLHNHIIRINRLRDVTRRRASLGSGAMSDLLFRPASELAGLVRTGELSARELVQASLDRIEALDPELNAFVDVYAEERWPRPTRSRAGDERPFAGVPIAIKNNRAITGKRLTFAAEFFGDWEAPYDHNVVRRFKEAGFVVVGSTTLPEWGILPWTNTKRFGPTRNPWDPARTSGGSSGGSAAAVAAGMVPSPTPTTAAARRGSRPRAAAWSASSPSATASRWRPRRARASWPSTACSRGRSRDTAAGARPAGRHRDRRRVMGAAAGRGLRRLRGARAGAACAWRWSPTRPSTCRSTRSRVEAAQRGRAPARVARPPRRGGAGAVARGQPAAGVHGALRPARHAADRLRPAGPGPRARASTRWSR